MKKLFAVLLIACLVGSAVASDVMAGRGGNGGNAGGNGSGGGAGSAGGGNGGSNGKSDDGNFGRDNRTVARTGEYGHIVGGGPASAPGKWDGIAHQDGWGHRSSRIQRYLSAIFGIGSAGEVASAHNGGLEVQAGSSGSRSHR